MGPDVVLTRTGPRHLAPRGKEKSLFGAERYTDQNWPETPIYKGRMGSIMGLGVIRPELVRNPRTSRVGKLKGVRARTARNTEGRPQGRRPEGGKEPDRRPEGRGQGGPGPGTHIFLIVNPHSREPWRLTFTLLVNPHGRTPWRLTLSHAV